MRSLLLALLVSGCSSASTPRQSTLPTTKPTYDADRAKRLGADEHGMRKYVMAFLVAGPNRDQPEAEAKALMKAHLENIGRLADERKLVLAGPFLDDGTTRGIYVFAVETIEEAAALTATDPAIKAGRLAMELHPWYGSAALVDLYEIHKAITQAKPE